MVEARRPKEPWLPWLHALGWGSSAALCAWTLALTLEILLLAAQQVGAGGNLWGLPLAWITLAPLGVAPALLMGASGGALWRVVARRLRGSRAPMQLQPPIEAHALAARAHASGPLLTATGALLLGVGAASEFEPAQALGLLLLCVSAWWVCMLAARPDQARSEAPAWRLAARWALARAALLWVALWACGLGAWVWGWARISDEGSLPLHRGPLAGLAVTALQRLADQDGDGRSPLLGGGDCDDRAPATFVGASDPSGDGVDQDCDGRDSSPSALAQRPLPLDEPATHGAAHHDEDAPTPTNEPDAEPPHEPDDEPDFTLEEVVDLAPSDEPDFALEDARAEDAPQDAPQEARGLERWVGRPILLITVDTLRPDFLGLAGARPSPSPKLDELAGEALWFPTAWSQGPLTKASVSSMMTGRYFSELHRTRDAWTRLLDENETLAERLVRLGYSTAAVTSHPYLDEPYGHAQGFERFEVAPNPDRQWHADDVTARGVALLDKLRAQGRPYFLWLHYLDPHHPYAPHPSLGRLAPDGAPWGEAPQRRYQAEIAWTDRHLGAFLDHARSSGALDEAVLVVHSDHGEGFREHGYEYHGQSLYDDQIRALLLLRAPGGASGRAESPAMLLDVFPTLLHLASGQAPGEPPLGRGRSLAPLLAGEVGDAQRPIFSEMRSDTRRSDLKAVRRGRWKLIHDLRADRWEWFDVEADPREARPLARAHDPAAFDALQSLLRGFEAEGIRTIPAR